MAVLLDSEVFLDSAYVIALAHSTDAYHDRAVEVAETIAARKTVLISTRAVILEIGNALARVRARTAAINLIGEIQASPLIRVIPLTEELAARGGVCSASVLTRTGV